MNKMPPDVQKQLNELEKLIADNRNRLAGLMSDEEINQIVLPLLAKKEALLAPFGGAREDTAVIAEQFWYEDPDFDQPELIPATSAYLKFLDNRYRTLEFRGLGFVNQLPGRLQLLNLFVPLKVRPFLPEGDTWPRQFVTDIENHEPVPILPLLENEDGLVLLGDVGAGKTTFLKYLALSLAMGHDVDETINGRIPLILPLSAYADELKNGNLSLQDFFVNYFNGMGVQLPLDSMFNQVLARGKGLFLLDGLDEVRDIALRHQVVQQILNFFALHRQNGNKLIVTSRLVGYRDARLLTDGLLECTIADLDLLAIEHFIDRWLLFVEKKAANSQDLIAEKETMLKAFRGNHSLKHLATNPLLLTIMILMRRQGVALPKQRVQLYDLFIRTLIKDWNLARNPQQASTTAVSDILETMQILAPLALWMEEDSPGVGLVQREDFRRQLETICRLRGYEQPATASRQFLDDIKQYSGILVEREDQNISFLHRSFQEYLAAWAIAQRGQSDLVPVVSFIETHLFDVTWWELLRLTVGIIGIVQQREEAAGIILSQLLDSTAGEGGSGLTLIGQILADIGPSGVTTAVYDDILRHLFQALQDDEEIVADWRVGIGHAIGQMGKGTTIVNEIQFCFVPDGDFFLGEDHFEQRVTALNTPYWISQYPITHFQFFEFVKDGGYENPAYWAEATAVNRWRPGEVMDWERLGWRKQPHDYGFPYNLPNHPIVGVSFYEALAFTRWLEARWQQRGYIERDWQIQLPSELHWEKAAKGGLQIPELPVEADVPILISVYDAFFESLTVNPNAKRPFPWGAESPSNHANFRHADNEHFDESSNYGRCFPKGQSPMGCYDMSGNVWEWTRSLLRPYPYDPQDGRETEHIQLFHTLAIRGGAFWSPEAQIRTVSRLGRSPNTRSDSIGFRVCVMVPNPPR
ncbi:MAG: SUMF1/EgtB/PvdO family nonheme iron enzyme [Chloroflexota bacterium]